jgi:hypothetical protein
MVAKVIILVILFMGFYVYIRIANKNRTEEIVGYFLGGRNIGQSLFEHTTWGTSFAFNNGIYWGLYLGYTLGLSALWINASWALGFFLLAAIIPRLIKPTGNWTIHGYLGSIYGHHTRVIASVASITAMIFNLGSEVVFASIFISAVLGIQSLELIFIFAFALFGATYCSIGGYRANAAIDRFQNLFSVASMLLLLYLLSITGMNQSQLKYVFLALGILFFALFVKESLQKRKIYSARDSLYLLIAVSFFIAIVFFSPKFSESLSAKSILNSLAHPDNATTIYIISLIAYQFLYQLVDTVNWQNISAHNISLEEKGKTTEIKKALSLAGLKILITPILTTTMIGYLFRTIGSPGSESAFILDMNSALLTDMPVIIAAICLGFLSFSFIGAGLSGVDSWLMAINQTLSWDILNFKLFKKKKFNVTQLTKEENRFITVKSKGLLFITAIIGAGLYYLLYTASDKKIIPLFFVIFSSALSLLPSLLFALFFSAKVNFSLGITSSLSIVMGYLAPICFLVPTLIQEYIVVFGKSYSVDDIYTWGPLLAIGFATIFFSISFIGYYINKKPIVYEEKNA